MTLVRHGQQIALGFEGRSQRQATTRVPRVHRAERGPATSRPGLAVGVVQERVRARRTRVVGHTRVCSRVGNRQEVTRFGTECEAGHLVIDHVEIDVRPCE